MATGKKIIIRSTASKRTSSRRASSKRTEVAASKEPVLKKASPKKTVAPTKKTSVKKAFSKKAVVPAKKSALKRGTLKKAAKSMKQNVAPKKALTDNYLTKRILIRAAATGFSQAAARTMKVMGQNLVVKNGWVVRVFSDGRIEKVTKIDSDNIPPLALD